MQVKWIMILNFNRGPRVVLTVYLGMLKNDNYPKYLLTTNALLQKRNGIIHANLIDFIREGKTFLSKYRCRPSVQTTIS